MADPTALEVLVSLGGGVVLTLFSQDLARRAGLLQKRGDVAAELGDIAPIVLMGEAGKDRPKYVDRVERVTAAARRHGSKEIRQAAEIVRHAFYRNEQPPGNIMGLADLSACIEFFVHRDSGNRIFRRRQRKLQKQNREKLTTNQESFAKINSEQLLGKMFGIE
jgi:hypothetical protein